MQQIPKTAANLQASEQEKSPESQCPSQSPDLNRTEMLWRDLSQVESGQVALRDNVPPRPCCYI